MFQIQYFYREGNEYRKGWAAITCHTSDFLKLAEAREAIGTHNFRILDLDTLTVHPVVAEKAKTFKRWSSEKCREMAEYRDSFVAKAMAEAAKATDRRKEKSILGRRIFKFEPERRKDAATRDKFKVIYDMLEEPKKDTPYAEGYRDGIRETLTVHPVVAEKKKWESMPGNFLGVEQYHRSSGRPEFPERELRVKIADLEARLRELEVARQEAIANLLKEKR